MATTYIAPFAKLVRQILIKERRASAREVAASLGLSYGAFHNRLNGRAHFSPDEITRLLCELDDIRLADCLLGQSGFLAVRSPVTGENHIDRTASKLGFSCVAEVLSALQGITDSVALHYFERKQRAEIEEHVRNAQRGLAALQLALPHLFTMSNINNNLKSVC
jgi:phage tail protein X